MNSSQETIQQLRRVIRRRKALLIITPVLFVALSYGVLQFIEPEYESSVSILIDESGTFNMFMMDDLNESSQSEDKLELFEEFMHSRSTIEMLIDSLEMDTAIHTEKEKQQLVQNVRNRIEITSETSDLFQITYYDEDPVRARDAAELLGTFFIDTRLRLQQRRNEETVEFFNTRLNELEEIMDEQREDIVSSTSERLKQTPANSEALQSRLRSINSKMEELDWQIYEVENQISILRNFLERSEDDFSIQPLYRLSLEDVPSAGDLAEFIQKYEELNQQFTESYPELQTMRTRITESANRVVSSLDSRLENLRLQREELSKRRTEVMNDMQTTFVAEQQNNTKQSTVSIYRELYDEMKVNLEQARMAKDINQKASEKYKIVDTPFVADSPTSPNPKIVLGAGLLLGFIIGGLLISVAELLDDTIRTEEDIKEFKKPVIAYLNDGKA